MYNLLDIGEIMKTEKCISWVCRKLRESDIREMDTCLAFDDRDSTRAWMRGDWYQVLADAAPGYSTLAANIAALMTERSIDLGSRRRNRVLAVETRFWLSMRFGSNAPEPTLPDLSCGVLEWAGLRFGNETVLALFDDTNASSLLHLVWLPIVDGRLNCSGVTDSAWFRQVGSELRSLESTTFSESVAPELGGVA